MYVILYRSVVLLLCCSETAVLHQVDCGSYTSLEV
jgi:hypothetical protein